MARALDAGSGDAFTGRTSELRGKETEPQPDRVGFKQKRHDLDRIEQVKAVRRHQIAGKVSTRSKHILRLMEFALMIYLAAL
jgi:hypothetical protein